MKKMMIAMLCLMFAVSNLFAQESVSKGKKKYECFLQWGTNHFIGEGSSVSAAKNDAVSGIDDADWKKEILADPDWECSVVSSKDAAAVKVDSAEMRNDERGMIWQCGCQDPTGKYSNSATDKTRPGAIRKLEKAEGKSLSKLKKEGFDVWVQKIDESEVSKSASNDSRAMVWQCGCQDPTGKYSNSVTDKTRPGAIRKLEKAEGKSLSKLKKEGFEVWVQKIDESEAGKSLIGKNDCEEEESAAVETRAAKWVCYYWTGSNMKYYGEGSTKSAAQKDAVSGLPAEDQKEAIKDLTCEKETSKGSVFADLVESEDAEEDETVTKGSNIDVSKKGKTCVCKISGKYNGQTKSGVGKEVCDGNVNSAQRYAERQAMQEVADQFGVHFTKISFGQGKYSWKN